MASLLAVVLYVRLRGLRCVVGGMQVVPMRQVCVVCCLFMVPCFMMLCCFLVMPCCVLMMFSSLVVVRCGFFRHRTLLL